MTSFTTPLGIDLHHEEFGDPDAPPVVFIRGTGAAGNRWMPQVDAYRERFFCVIFDNRGAGASSSPPPPYSVDDMAQDTLHLMDHLDIDAAHLVGSSLGAAIALRMGAREPERVTSLQLHSSWLSTTGYAAYSLNLLRSLLLMGGVEGYYEATIPLLFSADFLGEHFERVAEILAGMRAVAASYDGLMGQIAANLGHDGVADASAVTMPTFVGVGELDLLLPVSESRRLHEAIPGSAFHVFPRGGHLVSMESPAEFNAVTLAWLRSIGA